jgi:hypothetical protein
VRACVHRCECLYVYKYLYLYYISKKIRITHSACRLISGLEKNCADDWSLWQSPFIDVRDCSAASWRFESTATIELLHRSALNLSAWWLKCSENVLQWSGCVLMWEDMVMMRFCCSCCWWEEATWSWPTYVMDLESSEVTRVKESNKFLYGYLQRSENC